MNDLPDPKCQDCGKEAKDCECDPEGLIGAAKTERVRLKKDGLLEEIQTSFGLLSVLHHPLLDPKCQDCGEFVKDCKCERCQCCGELAEGWYLGEDPLCFKCHQDGE